MGIIRMPTGETAVTMGTDEETKRQQEVINARHAFNLKYMKERGWGDDTSVLTIQQIMEIREQPGWKNPVIE